MRCLNGITNSRDMSLCTLWDMVKDREAWHAAVHGVTKGWTELSHEQQQRTEKQNLVLKSPFQPTSGGDIIYIGGSSLKGVNWKEREE